MPVQHKKIVRSKGDKAIDRLRAKLKEAQRVIAEEADLDLPSTARGTKTLEQQFPVLTYIDQIR